MAGFIDGTHRMSSRQVDEWGTEGYQMQYERCCVSGLMRERSLFIIKRALIAFSISPRQFGCSDHHLANMVSWQIPWITQRISIIAQWAIAGENND